MVYSQVEKVCKHCRCIFRVHNCRKDKAVFCSVFCRAKGISDVAREQREGKLQSGEKQCTQCKTIKPFSDFYPMVDKSDGLDVWCKKCKIEANKEYQKIHAEKLKSASREWRAVNRERLQAKRRAHHTKNRDHDNERTRRFNLQRKYGLTLEEYKKLLEDQGYKCLICESNIAGASAKLDHCHKAKKIRGFLCNNCNAGIGLFKDSERLLMRAIEYLRVTCYQPAPECFS